MSKVEWCQEEGCHRKAVVGWGKFVVWLCQEHFEQRLSGVKAAMDTAQQLTIPKGAKP